jgi:hypothetical protein
MDAETEKWDEPQNEIAKRAKNMSSMAFSMYLFTRGEGTLRTTQDLFTQAYYFVEEGSRLTTIVQEFANQVKFEVMKILIEVYFRFRIKHHDKRFYSNSNKFQSCAIN